MLVHTCLAESPGDTLVVDALEVHLLHMHATYMLQDTYVHRQHQTRPLLYINDNVTRIKMIQRRREGLVRLDEFFDSSLQSSSSEQAGPVINARTRWRGVGFHWNI